MKRNLFIFKGISLAMDEKKGKKIWKEEKFQKIT